MREGYGEALDFCGSVSVVGKSGVYAWGRPVPTALYCTVLVV